MKRQHIPATRLVVITEIPIAKAQAIISAALRKHTKAPVSFHNDRPRYVGQVERGRKHSKLRIHRLNPNARYREQDRFGNWRFVKRAA